MNAIVRNNWFPTMMNDFIFGDMMPKTQPQYSTPKMNISENGQGYSIELAAPGMKKEDFTIRLTLYNRIGEQILHANHDYTIIFLEGH